MIPQEPIRILPDEYFQTFIGKTIDDCITEACKWFHTTKNNLTIIESSKSKTKNGLVVIAAKLKQEHHKYRGF